MIGKCRNQSFELKQMSLIMQVFKKIAVPEDILLGLFEQF